MKVRTYRGNEVNTLMTQIKEEVGDEAVIISMNETKGVIEIEVGLEDAPLELSHPLDLQHTSEMPESIVYPTTGSKKSRIQTLQSEIEELIQKHGISPTLAKKISHSAQDSFKTELSVDRYVSAGIEQEFEFNSLLPSENKVVAFVGATGVGKTTTIAKLAARLRMGFEMNIALISADAYRVGAGFHLQTYASLLNLPFRSVDTTFASTAKQIRDAVDAFEDFDLILIDTAGCGPRETGRIEELADSLSLVPEAEKLLVLPAPSNDHDLHAAASAFEVLDYSRIVLSKADESGFIGPVLNTVHTLGRPLSFITTGQRVPEDIEPASARRLGWMLTRSMH